MTKAPMKTTQEHHKTFPSELVKMKATIQTILSRRARDQLFKFQHRRVSIAIVGSGPSGFYTAKYLKRLPEGNDIEIDMFERLPTPYGLVRSGVAPDHPEVKNVENDFVDVARSGNFNFFGNVTIGHDLHLNELRDVYDAVVLAYGCSSDNRLPNHVEGSNLKGILSAREFVAWYNGHPDFVDMTKDVNDILSTGDKAHGDKKVVIIGQGNVALDCARILAKTSVLSDLESTDIAQHFIESPPMKNSSIKAIYVMGRRGHHQAAFTIKELRELTKLKETNVVVKPEELDLGSTAASLEEIKDSRPRMRMDKLLRDTSAQINEANTSNEIQLRFLLNPISFIENPDKTSYVGAVLCERTELVGNPGSQVAKGTGQTEVIDADLVLTSIGYRGKCIPDFEASFDEVKGVAVHDQGRCFKSGDGLYVSGWLKRGPSGIIGTNINDAKETVASIAQDLKNGVVYEKSPKGYATKEILSLLNHRGVQPVDWNAYEKIDNSEKKPDRLRSPSQPRQKIVSIEEMLKISSNP